MLIFFSLWVLLCGTHLGNHTWDSPYGTHICMFARILKWVAVFQLIGYPKMNWWISLNPVLGIQKWDLYHGETSFFLRKLKLDLTKTHRSHGTQNGGLHYGRSHIEKTEIIINNTLLNEHYIKYIYEQIQWLIKNMHRYQRCVSDL